MLFLMWLLYIKLRSIRLEYTVYSTQTAHMQKNALAEHYSNLKALL